MELLNTIDRKRMVRDTQVAIDDYCVKAYDDGNRTHLGASLIGEPCNRFLWYTFRWIIQMQYRGTTPEAVAANHARMQRLFNRGHETEARFVEWLRGAGYTVQEYAQALVWDEGTDRYAVVEWDNLNEPLAHGWIDATGDGAHVKRAEARGIELKQWRIADCEGHFGGSNDGEGFFPPHFNFPYRILFEFKTHNRKSFAKLLDKGLRETKPKHWNQMCTYGHKRGIKYALYCAINKDDDDTHFEILELDHGQGAENIRKASYIIQSQTPPPRLHEVPTHVDCKFCDAHTVCHQGGPYLKSCRSCQHAHPLANKEWGCAHFQQKIPPEYIPRGCDNWHPIGRVK